MFAAMPRCLRLGLLSVLLLMTVPATALAAPVTLTVDPADANNACTRGTDNTCKTIGQAVAAAQPSDTISILKGTYAENVTIPSSLTGLTMTGADGVTIAPTGSSDVLTVQATGLKASNLTISTPADGGSAVRVDSSGGATFTKLTATRTAGAAVADPLVDNAGARELDASALLVQVAKAGTPVIDSSGTGGLTLADVVAANFAGPVVTISASDKNAIVRSTLLSAEQQGATSSAVSLTSANAGARALTADSSIMLGGPAAPSVAVTTTGTSAGDATLTLRHDTLPDGAKQGIALDASGAHGTGAVGIPPAAGAPSGNITATVSSSIVHPASSATGYQSSDGGLLTTSNKVTLTFDHSDAPPATTAGGATADMGGASNTPKEQLFAKGFTLRADAPVIDKGGPVANGESTKDVQGDPRTAGAATDIGADEFVNQPPKADFNVTNANPKQGEFIGILSSSSDPEQLSGAGGGIVEYTWDFGDGSAKVTSSSPATIHAWANLGTYTITLTVKDKQGLTASATKTVTVKDGTPPDVTTSTPTEGKTLKLNPTVKRRVGKKHHKRTVIKKLKPYPFTAIGKVADSAGVSKVEVALYLTSGKTCRFYTGRTFSTQDCAKGTWLPATLQGDAWQFITRKGLRIKAGHYVLRVRATDANGNVTTTFSKATHTLVHFRVK